MNTREPEPPPLGATVQSAPDGATPEVAANADVPPELRSNALAAAEWTRLAPMLTRARQITEADRGALIALCLEWSRYLEATDKVRQSGMVIVAASGYPMQNPYLPILTKALAACRALWPELGLTPSSRSRVSAGERAVAPDDPFAEFDAPPPVPPSRRPS